ncbi:MAG: glutamate formimidoyltransferase [Syntrophales bacterium]
MPYSNKEKIMECVPNFSEGRDAGKVKQIVDSISSITGVRVLDFSLDADHNRCVVTFIGTSDSVFMGAMAACNKANALIDMRCHRGVHPRIGAVDVVPFIPLLGANMEDAVKLAHRFGYAFAEECRVPVYFYGKAALYPERCELSNIRKGGCEALSEKLTDPSHCPDAGPAEFIACSGATSVGARFPLVAFNLNLDSNDLTLAKKIAAAIRESAGGLRHVRAIGICLESRNIVQISMNLTDYRVTSIPDVFYRVRDLASRTGVQILESELIGLIPRAALGEEDPKAMKIKDFTEKKILETYL